MADQPASDQLPLTSMSDVLRQMAEAVLPWCVGLAVVVVVLIVAKALMIHALRSAPPLTVRARVLRLVDGDDDADDDLEAIDPPWDAEREEALREAWAELEPFEWPSDHHG